MDFQQACRNGRPDIIRWLLVTEGVGEICKSTYDACVRGHLSVVKRLVKKDGANLNFYLNRACQFGQLLVAKWLLSQGARGSTASWNEACRWGYPRVARWIARQNPQFFSKRRQLQLVSFFNKN